MCHYAIILCECEEPETYVNISDSLELWLSVKNNDEIPNQSKEHKQLLNSPLIILFN